MSTVADDCRATFLIDPDGNMVAKDLLGNADIGIAGRQEGIKGVDQIK